MPSKMESPEVQTTVRLPRSLYERLKALARESSSEPTMNRIMVTALREHLRKLRDQRIDRAFAAMATDEHYRRESQMLAENFAVSDWEALESAEGRHGRHGRTKAR